jgi:hypothetical protein
MPRFDNYVPVAERVTAAQSLLLTTTSDQPVMLTESMGYIRCTVTLTDGRSAVGTATFRLDLTTKSAQATNPIEDCETSAIGRALAFLGFESTRGIASREEVHEARRRESAPPPAANPPINRVLTRTPEQRRLQLWSALNDRVLESKALGLRVQDAQQMQIDGNASNEEIIAMGKALSEAIAARKAVPDDDDGGSFVPVAENVELFPNGVPA